MMSRWSRNTPLASGLENLVQETWVYHPGDGRATQSFPMQIRVGKALDVMGLKGTDLGEVRDYAAGLEATADRLYGRGIETRRVETCPCCRRPTDETMPGMLAFGIPYVRCLACGHAFVLDQPGALALAAGFAESESLSATYTDAAVAERRINDIGRPKLDWTTQQFSQKFQRAPASTVDVGAGGGHFVETARRQGLRAEGFEVSASSRAFAKAAFGLALRDDDFLAAPAASVDIVTMWGLLEYTPEPLRFLETARRWLAPDNGLLIVEVPRYDAISTVVQANPPSWIARHMDPTSHINCFSDSSIATAIVESGFEPIAAWYFGLDAYELMVQTALRLGDVPLDRLADLIPDLQAAFDRGRQCDDLIIAAVPRP